MKKKTTRRAERLIQLAVNLKKSTPLDKSKVNGIDRSIVRSAIKSCSARKKIYAELGINTGPTDEIESQLSGLETQNLTEKEIATLLQVRKATARQLLGLNGRLSKGDYSDAACEVTASFVALWMSRFIRCAVFELHHEVIPNLLERSPLSPGDVMASPATHTLIEFEQTMSAAMSESASFPSGITVSRELCQKDNDDFLTFLRDIRLMDVRPNYKRLAIIELVSDTGSLTTREAALGDQIKNLAQAEHVEFVHDRFDKEVIAFMASVHRQGCTTGFFGDLRAHVLPALRNANPGSAGTVFYYHCRSQDRALFAVPKRRKIRCQNGLSPYRRTIRRQSLLPVFPVVSDLGKEEHLPHPSGHIILLDGSAIPDLLFEGLVSRKFGAALKMVIQEASIGEIGKLEGGFMTLIGWYESPDVVAQQILRQVGPKNLTLRKLVCGTALMHFSVDLILHAIPESFSSLLNDWAETIQNELMPGSLALDTDVELDEHEEARSLCVESSLNAARESLKCHLQSVLRAYLEALEQEAPRLWELSSKSPEAIRRYKIPLDSALQNFWPNDPTFDLGNLRSMLANSLPDDFMPDGGNHSTLLHLDAPIKADTTFSLYDVVSSEEPVTYDDAYDWAEKISLGQIPPLAPGTIDTAVEYTQMLAAEGNDPDFFLGELPPALSQIVRASLKAP